jgi:hypothetical protein
MKTREWYHLYIGMTKVTSYDFLLANYIYTNILFILQYNLQKKLSNLIIKKINNGNPIDT